MKNSYNPSTWFVSTKTNKEMKLVDVLQQFIESFTNPDKVYFNVSADNMGRH